MLRTASTHDVATAAMAGRALKRILTVLGEYDVANREIELIIVDFRTAISENAKQYATDACIAIPDDFQKPVILCNFAYLAEIEGVIRKFSFDIGNTAELRAFVRLVSSDPATTIARFREETQNQENRNVQATELAFMFVLGHEVGHLLSGTRPAGIDERPLTESSTYREAILRLCKQADQFKKHNALLEGAGSVIDPFSAQRRFIEKYREENKTIDVLDEIFRDEEVADAFGEDIAAKYFNFLANTAKRSVVDKETFRFAYFVETLAIYFWHKALFSFVDLYCEGQVLSLSTCFMWEQSRFVSAANLFGKFHRNIYLRAFDMLATIVSQRSTYFDLPYESQFTVAPYDVEHSPDRGRNEDILTLYSVIQLGGFLSELNDTPIKIAYFGCTLGWVREERGGTVPFMLVKFYNYGEEIIRYNKQLGPQRVQRQLEAQRVQRKNYSR